MIKNDIPADAEKVKAMYAELGKGLESGWVSKEPPQNTPKSPRKSLREIQLEALSKVQLESRSEEEYQQAKLREFQMFERSYREAVNRLMSKKDTPAQQAEPATNASPQKDE